MLHGQRLSATEAECGRGHCRVEDFTVGAVTHEALRDREHLARDGVIVATLLVDHDAEFPHCRVRDGGSRGGPL
jgi:mRNA degradation ribonuclease J1/J2